MNYCAPPEAARRSRAAAEWQALGDVQPDPAVRLEGLNRGGDRAANALYTIALCRMRYDPGERLWSQP